MPGNYSTKSLLKNKTCYGTSKCLFWTDKTKGYLNINEKIVFQMLLMCEGVARLPQNLIFSVITPRWGQLV